MTTIHPASAAILIMLAGLLPGTAAQAQTMFRCGSSYQDHPCEGKDPGKVIGHSGVARASAKPGSDASCVQRGADSQKIVWAREGGALAEQQLAEARTAQQRKLIADVYQKRGTSTEISAAIEAECVSEKERAAQAATLIEAAKLLAPPTPGVGAGPNSAAEPDRKVAESAAAKDNAARDAAIRKSRCENLRTQRENVMSRQRAGGSGATMDSLYQQQRTVDKQLTENGC